MFTHRTLNVCPDPPARTLSEAAGKPAWRGQTNLREIPMKKPAILLLIIAASFFAVGLANDPLAPPELPLRDLIHSALVTYSGVVWCLADLSRRSATLPKRVGAGGETPDTPPLGLALPNGTTLLVLILPPLGIPIYLFHTRPWREALKVCGKVALFYALCLAVSWFGAFLRVNAAGD